MLATLATITILLHASPAETGEAYTYETIALAEDSEIVVCMDVGSSVCVSDDSDAPEWALDRVTFRY